LKFNSVHPERERGVDLYRRAVGNQNATVELFAENFQEGAQRVACLDVRGLAPI
jgi:hypothetical protein